MKKVKKITGFIMMVFALLVSVTGVASAASTDFTGMKDDVYSAETAVPGEAGQSYKMNFTVEGGKVTNFTFGQYVGTIRYSEGFLKAITDPKKQEELKEVVAAQDYYTQQMASVGDALKVAKYPKSTNNNMYSAFQSLWKQLVTKGGGKTGAGTTTNTGTSTTGTSTTKNSNTTTTTSSNTNVSSNPKTGDNGILGYVIVAGAALAGIALMGKKKLTA